MSEEMPENTGANDGGSQDLAQLSQDIDNLKSATSEGDVQQNQHGGITPEEHRERSALGRKVASLEEKFDRVLNALERQQKTEHHLPPVPPSQMRRQENQDDLPDIIATPEDVLKVLEMREKKITISQQAYEQDYIFHVEQNRALNPEEHDEVVKEMLTNFNRKLSDNPRADAQYNYALALKAVVKKAAARGRVAPNLKQDNADGIGVSQAISQDKSTTTPVKLSPAAEYYARKTGRSAEWVQAALGSEMPMAVAGKVRG